MNTYDNELNIIENLQLIPKSFVCVFPHNSNTISILNSIRENENWKKWSNSSSKSAPPPDFYSDGYGLMMEVMRVDDHTYKNKKGKLVNPTNIKESKIKKEILQSDWIKSFPNIKNIFINAPTNLPSKEDHNYKYYCDSFKRVLKHHIEKIPLYRKNHPNHKLIFLIFDETSPYLVVDTEEEASKNVLPGQIITGKIHNPWLDKAMIDVLKGADIDYIIWFKPYNHINFVDENKMLPLVFVLDTKSINDLSVEDYPANLVVSAEE